MNLDWLQRLKPPSKEVGVAGLKPGPPKKNSRRKQKAEKIYKPFYK